MDRSDLQLYSLDKDLVDSRHKANQNMIIEISKRTKTIVLRKIPFDFPEGEHSQQY